MKNLLLLSLLTVMFLSCDEVIDVDVDNEVTRFVVEGKITDRPGPYAVILSKSAGFFDHGETPRVSGATVIISDDAVPVNIDTLVEKIQGTYQTDSLYRGVIGRTYFLKIISEEQEYAAQDYLAPVCKLDSINIRPDIFEKNFPSIRIYALETKGEGDYYRWNVFFNEDFVNDTGYIVVSSDEGVDGNYANGHMIYSDLWGNRTPEEGNIKPGTKIRVEQLSISEQVFEFYVQLMANASNMGGMFDPPPANVKGNIKKIVNGKAIEGEALGIFCASAVSTAEIIVGETQSLP